ncbi:MAG: hypothetical protein IIC18_09050 [Bacteroidetes bacterium]|nr:hypothetical protein [Bacteroidota bacterium]
MGFGRIGATQPTAHPFPRLRVRNGSPLFDILETFLNLLEHVELLLDVLERCIVGQTLYEFEGGLFGASRWHS